MNSLKEKTLNQLSKIKNIILSLIAYSVLFISGVVYEKYQNMVKDKLDVTIYSPLEVINNDEIRIAIDSENKLIMIDRQKGTYNIYSDTIGNTIFRMYMKELIK